MRYRRRGQTRCRGARLPGGSQRREIAARPSSGASFSKRIERDRTDYDRSNTTHWAGKLAVAVRPASVHAIDWID